MHFRVKLLDLQTNEERIVDEDWGNGSDESFQFYWEEGNMACDCNRSKYFLSPDEFDNYPCNTEDNRFKLVFIRKVYPLEFFSI